MARITGSLKDGGSNASLEVDETKIQEIIAEEKKHSVELAQEDYKTTHVENDDSKDEKLTPAQIKQRKQAQVQSQMQNMHNPHHNEGSAFSLFVITVSAATAAFLLHKRVPSELHGCMNVYGIDHSLEKCREAVLSQALPLVPGCGVVALLPALSEVFKRRKSVAFIFASVIARIFLFTVLFLMFLQGFIYYL